ncbi:helix-turn-helix domain-containing protein [Kitasatospora sp. NPDC056327]|uniref:helix-turn-helix domain-containing protein n=1 Tax=Kitasatospora sp. NPDC056327 TaxID=3345785 RepID=UPI0035D963E5
MYEYGKGRQDPRLPQKHVPARGPAGRAGTADGADASVRLGSHLRVLREGTGLSLRHVERHLRESKSSIGRFERGERLPRKTYLDRLHRLAAEGRGLREGVTELTFLLYEAALSVDGNRLLLDIYTHEKLADRLRARIRELTARIEELTAPGARRDAAQDRELVAYTGERTQQGRELAAVEAEIERLASYLPPDPAPPAGSGRGLRITVALLVLSLVAVSAVAMTLLATRNDRSTAAPPPSSTPPPASPTTAAPAPSTAPPATAATSPAPSTGVTAPSSPTASPSPTTSAAAAADTAAPPTPTPPPSTGPTAGAAPVVYWSGTAWITFDGTDFDSDPPTVDGLRAHADLLASLTQGERISTYGRGLALVPPGPDPTLADCNRLFADVPSGTINLSLKTGDRICVLTGEKHVAILTVIATEPHGGQFEKNRLKVSGTVWTDPARPVEAGH